MVWELCFHYFVDCMYACLESRWFLLHQWLCYKVCLRSTAVSEKNLPKDDAKHSVVERNWHNWLLLAILFCNAWLNMSGVQWTAFTVFISCYYSLFRRFCASVTHLSAFPFLSKSTLVWTSFYICTHLRSVSPSFHFLPLSLQYVEAL